MATLFKDVLMVDGGMEKARRGHLLVSKGRIESVLDLSATPPPADKVVAGKGRMAVMPGLVNAHGHAAMMLLRGMGEEAPLMEWLQKKIWPIEEKLTPDHIYWGTAAAILEMLATGTTCFADMYFEMERVAEAVLGAGMRAALCRGLTVGEPGKIQRSLAENLELADKWHGREGLLTVQLGPHAPYTVPFQEMETIVKEAKDRGLGIQFHFLETEWELNYIRDELKKTPQAYLEETGLLSSHGTVLAHAVWMDPALSDRLDLSHVTLVHNPCSNLKLGSGLMPLQSWLDRDVAVALGTDGASSNNRLDMWGEMRMAALLHKGVTRNPVSVSALDVLHMATYEGAKALGFAQKGMIREGWMADLVLVDLDQPHYVGVDEENLAMYLVYAGSAADVTGTMVNGKWLYRNGDFPTLDREEIIRKAREARETITKS